MPLTIEKPGLIPALTGLRFFAALMVFFSHYPIPTENQDLFLLQTSGFNGVTFFFVLSGFIITYNYLDRFESRPLVSTPRYLLARFARIYPLYSLLIIYPWLNTGGSTPLLPYLTAMQAWSSDLFLAMGLNSPAWSISVEFFLYLIFPFAIPLLRITGILASRNRIIVLATFIVLAQLAIAFYFTMPERRYVEATDPASAHRWLYRGPAYRSLDFVLGILAAVYYRRFYSETKAATAIWRVITYACLAYVFILATSWTLSKTAFKFDAAYAAPYTMLILSVVIANKTRVSNFLAHPKIVLLGESSYAFYLVHVLFGAMYIRYQESSISFMIIHQTVFLGAVICFSVGLHICIEKPCQKIIVKLFRNPQKSRDTIKNQSK